MLRKAKETLLPYKRCFVDLSTDHRMETVLHIEEEPPVERAERKAQEHKRSSSNQSVQSVQVSTSAVETRGTAPSARLEEECREGSEGGGSEDAGPGLDGEAQTSSSLGAGVAAANKAGLPPALKRDLTKHISSKSKAGGHEPNLNIARRIRNLSGARRADAEKDSGLKPTVRQLISSSGSRRNVNWEQVYQEVCRKKQEQGKGMPRFGIEMVSCEQEGLSQEEDDIPLTEGFQWESFISVPPAGISPVTTRKRSLSESSIAPESSLFTSKTSGPRAAMVEGPSRPGRRNSEQQGVSSTLATPVSRYGNRGKQQTEDGVDRQLKARSQTLDEGPPGASQQQPDSVVVDSSSGAEQNDAHGSGKKRRAAGDVPSPEIPFPEKNNKRRKTKKSKKERSQVDQLLAVSLREEELSLDLQTLDNSLIQARAALQVAYIEVQRLLMVKQQVNMEMSTLRSKRIELLQGMQGGLENAPSPRVKEMEEEMALAPAEPHMPLLLSPTTDAAVPSPSQAPQGPVCTSPPPPSSSVDAFTQSVVIKQEPLSPVRVDSELDPVGSIVHRAHSSTPESALIPSPSDPALPCQPVTVLTRRLSQSLGEPADWKESSTSGKAVQTVQMGLLAAVDSKPPSFLSPASRRGSQALTPTDPAASPPHETLPSPPACPPSPPELRSGKRVRKLKKKKRDPRKSQGAEQPDSDTELDGETSRPTRRLHLRRRSSGFQVSTSTSPNATLDDGARERGEDAPGAASPAGEPGEEDSDSTVEVVEPRQVAQVAAVNVDTSDSNMDISPASHESEPSCQPTAPDTGKEQPQTLACNEVSSTSEMEVSAVIKTCDSDIRLPLTSLKVKTLSDVPSDCGEDKPTEGAFEGHQETVNAMQVHNGMLYTCSGDRTVKAFNLRSRKCVAVFEGHSTKVNCLVVSSGPRLPQRLYSGSSDQTIRCYSLRTRLCVEQFSLPDRVLCLHSRWNVLYAGLANGSVATFNLKTNKQVDVFECHGPRAVSCLASAQEGARRILLVGSFDSTISVRDAKTGLLLRTLEGHTKTVLCMEVVSDLVFSGSSDQSVHAHNIHTGQLVRIYKGHSHGVTVVAMLGKVMVTACLDKLVRVYELQSHEQLQVYNGHSDMVMCMTIHQSMIYTGCYDGSVQAVKLNLIQNHRCLWHGCSLIFGVQEHLHQHLLSDHAGPNVPLLKCRWKNCDAFFSARNGSKQGMPKHMQAHVEECQSEC